MHNSSLLSNCYKFLIIHGNMHFDRGNMYFDRGMFLGGDTWTERAPTWMNRVLSWLANALFSLNNELDIQYIPIFNNKYYHYMRLKCIFRITVLVFFSYLGWANNDTLKIPFERKLGSLSFAKSSGAVNIKDNDTTNPWNKTFVLS